jgi:hypothetical protein
MPRWVVKTQNVIDPTAPRSLAPAASPPYTPTPFSVHGGLVRFAAAPGTVAIASPRPTGVDQRSPSGYPPVQDRRGSDIAPNAFLPRLDVVYPDNMQPPVRWVSTNEVPLPAGNYVRLPMIASNTPPRIGGLGVIPAPRVFTRWPSIVPSIPSDN